MRWDQFKAAHVEKYKAPLKRKTSNSSIISEEAPPDARKAFGEGWNIKETDGEKHSKRIKVLNAKKRNEAFDLKYEESKEEREERQSIADQKRNFLDEIPSEK